MRTNLIADTCRRLFQQKQFFQCGKIVAFWTVFCDNIDIWMTKITIKANQFDMDVL